MKFSSRMLITLLAFATLTGCGSEPEFRHPEVEPLEPAAEVAGPNWDGELFRLSDHQGEISVVMFGYTYCPDICPITLSKMKSVKAQLGDDAGDVNFVFITVDPERDTQEKLAEYIPGFDPDFYGVYLEGRALEEVKAGYSAVSEKRYAGGAKEGDFYYVDHTSNLFVIDRQGNLRLRIPMTAEVEDMAADLKALLQEETA